MNLHCQFNICWPNTSSPATWPIVKLWDYRLYYFLPCAWFAKRFVNSIRLNWRHMSRLGCTNSTPLFIFLPNVTTFTEMYISSITFGCFFIDCLLYKAPIERNFVVTSHDVNTPLKRESTFYNFVGLIGYFFNDNR